MMAHRVAAQLMAVQVVLIQAVAQALTVAQVDQVLL
jgi:hypothetical protein